MTKKNILLILLCSLSLSAKTQVRLMVGGVAGRYKYLESIQANMAAKFNLGYEYSYHAGSNTADFNGSNDIYEVTKEMHWNQSNTGIIFGIQLQLTDFIAQSLYFEGKSNSASGERTNVTQNYEEKFALKSKFGGIHYNFIVTPTDRIGIFYHLGFTKYRLKFSATSPNSDVYKNETMGYKLHTFSGKYTPGSKETNIVNGFGLDIALLKKEKIDISIRPEIGFAFNDMSEVGLTVWYGHWIFNLNFVQVGLVIKPKIGQ